MKFKFQTEISQQIKQNPVKEEGKQTLPQIQSKKNFLLDPSLWFLLLSNFVAIFFAIKENWPIFTIMWVYWFQSITIGFFNFIRILQLKEFSTQGFKINGQAAQPTNKTKIFTAFFFLVHYGFFHLGYAVFLFTGNNASDTTEWKYILLTGLIFFVNHLFSYFYNKPRDTKKQNIGSLMFYPYARIIPMHLTILFGFIFTNAIALTVFLMLKTFADGIMHVVEHRVLKKGEEPQT